MHLHVFFMFFVLQLFTEYGRLALEANDNVSKPFQVSCFTHFILFVPATPSLNMYF